MNKSNKISFKRILSFLMATLMLLSVPTIVAFAGTGTEVDPYTTYDNPEMFPEYPEEGYVGTDKTASWKVVNGQDNDYAQIKLSNNSIPTAEGADVVLVLDYSGSMGSGISDANSNCMHTDHVKTVTFTQPVDYWVTTSQVGSDWMSWEKFYFYNALLTVSATVHQNPAYGYTTVLSYTISGFATEVDGYAVTKYRVRAKGAASWLPTSGFTPEVWNENGNSTIVSMLAANYGGTTDSTGTYTFPSSTARIVNENHTGWFSSTYGCEFRIDVLKAAARDFLTEIYKPIEYYDYYGVKRTIDSKFRVSLVMFSDTAAKFDSGTFYGASTANKERLSTGLESRIASGGTSYYSALTAAKEVIAARSGAYASRPAFVLFMSDGHPEGTGEYSATDGTPSTKVQGAIDALHNLSIPPNGDKPRVYSVGVGLSRAADLVTIQAVASEPGFNQNVSDDPGVLSSLFTQIARSMVGGGKNATIYDTVDTRYWELLPNSDSFPWEIKIEGTKVPLYGVSMVGDDTVKWECGNIPAVATFTFWVKAKLVKDGYANGMTPGYEYPTNTEGHIIYQNDSGDWLQQDYDTPYLPYPGGSIRVLYYMTNADGRAVAKSGATLQNSEYDTIRQSGYFVKSDQITVPDGLGGYTSILPINTLFSRTETDFISDAGTQYRISTALRVYNAKDEDTTTLGSNTWALTLEDHADAFYVLVGVKPEFVVNVRETTMPDNTTVETRYPTTIGEALVYSPNPPVNYATIASSFSVIDVDGNPVTNHGITMNSAGDLTGNMPYANVIINYTYRQEDGISYVVYYHKDDVNSVPYDTVRGYDGVLGQPIPYDAVPPTGYLTGAGQPSLTGKTVVEMPEDQNVMHVTWSKKDTEVPYTVYYCRDSKDDIAEKLDLEGTWMQTINLDIPNHIPTGYTGNAKIEPDGVTLILDAYDKVFYVIYNQPIENLAYEVQYYVDSVDAANLDLSVPGTGYYGQTIPYDTTYVPHGYELPGTIDPSSDTKVGLVEPPAGNVLRLVFTEKTTKLPVIINYYINDTSGVPYATETVYGTYGDPVTVDYAAHRPTGYTGVPTIVNNSPRFSEPTFDLAPDNVVNVIWTDENLDEYDWFVYYYTNQITLANRYDTRTGKDPYGTVIPLDDTIMPPAGYYGPAIITGANTVSENPGNNVKYVLYPNTQRYIYDYVVEYYKDDDSGAPFKTVTGSDYFGEDIPLNIDGNCPTGYDPDNVEIIGPTTVEVVDPGDSNVVKVIYKERISNIPYEVRYYKDNYASEANFLNKTSGVGYYGQDLVADNLIDATLFVPDGYKTPGVISGRTVLAMSGNIIYVVYAEKAIDIKYTVYYYKDAITTPADAIHTVTGEGAYGDAISVNLWLELPEGYVGPGKRSGAATIGLDESLNVVNVLYNTKRTDVQVMVRYYKDSVDDEANYIGGAYTYGMFGDLIHPNLTLYAPVGYKTPGAMVPDDATFPAEDGMIVKVVYTKGLYTVTVNYYQDYIASGNLKGTETIENLGLGDFIDADMYAYAPDGYYTPGTWYGPYYVQYNGNVISIVYDTKISGLTGTIYYYIDSIDAPDDNNLVGESYVTGTFGGNIIANLYAYAPSEYKTPGVRSGATKFNLTDNDVYVLYAEKKTASYTISFYKDTKNSTPLGQVTGTAALGTDLTQLQEVLDAQEDLCPVGYVSPGTWYGNTIVVSGSNIVSVVFDTKMTGLEYNIIYWKDDMTGTPLGTVTKYGTFGDPIQVDRTMFCPYGYYVPGTLDPATQKYISVDISENVVNVIYDNANLTNYTIYWYKDGINTTPLDTMTGTAVIGSTITVDAYHKAPYGYQTPGTVIGSTVAQYAGQVISVIYDQKMTGLWYEIKYYKDDQNGEYLGSVTNFGTYGDPIPVNVNAKKPTPASGWNDGIIDPNSSTYISEPNDPDYSGNIVWVYYTSKDAIEYTVEYYKDSYDPANYLDKYEGSGYVGDDMLISNTLYRPDGYSGEIITGGQLVITSDPAANVGYVVYTTRNSYAYTVYYWKDSMDLSSNRITSRSGYELYGETIPVDHSICPTGYDPASAEYDGPLTIGVSGNVLNVIYKTNLYEYIIYYVAGDTFDRNNIHYTEKDTAPFGTTITPTYNTDTIPPGYTQDGAIMSSGTWVISDNETTNIWYVLFPNVKTDLTVTVHYYKDAVTVPSTSDPNYLNTADTTGSLGETFDALVARGAIDLNRFKPPGYSDGVPSNNAYYTVQPSDTVFNIVYPGANEYGYKIIFQYELGGKTYYIDTVTGTGLYGTAIEPTQAQIDLYKPDGFGDGGALSGVTTITDVTADNVAYYTYNNPNELVTVRVMYYSPYVDKDYCYFGNWSAKDAPGYADYTFEALVGTTINLSSDVLNLYKSIAGANFLDGVQVPTDYVVVDSDNVIKVVYLSEDSLKAKVYVYWWICPGKDKAQAIAYTPIEFGDQKPYDCEWNIGTTISYALYYEKWGLITNPNVGNCFDVTPNDSNGMKLEADPTLNVINFYYEPIDNSHLGLFSFNTAFGEIEALAEDTIEIGADLKINIDDVLEDEFMDATFTLIAAPIDVIDDAAVEAELATEELEDEAITEIVQNVVDTIIADTDAETVVVSELTLEELEDYVFAPGYNYSLIVNYHTDSQSPLIIDAIESFNAGEGGAERAVLDESARRANDSVARNDGDRTPAARNEDDEDNGDSGHSIDVEPEPEGDVE